MTGMINPKPGCHCEACVPNTPRNTSGPADTWGCACVADDARTCARLRGVDEDGYRCQCECHVRLEEEWREEDAEAEE